MLEPHPEGVILSIQAQPKARKNAITGVHAGRLKVAVTPAPEKGKANGAIIRLLADVLKISRSQIELISGETASAKRLLISKIEQSVLAERIDAALQAKGKP